MELEKAKEILEREHINFNVCELHIEVEKQIVYSAVIKELVKNDYSVMFDGITNCLLVH